MDPGLVITLLEKNKQVFEALLSDISDDLRHWRPTPEKWNLLEIVCHLFDEEQLDFRARIKHILEMPLATMPPIDPAGWVKEKEYASRDYDQVVELFLAEREISIQYLKNLGGVNWQTTTRHPTLKKVTAGYFLYNWLAHDYLHIRQINRYAYLFFKKNSGLELSYAGDW